MSRSCKTCKYNDPAQMLVRCILCRPEMKDWEPKDRNQTAHCESCRHEEKSAYREPCLSCGIAWPGSSSHWEPKEKTVKRYCENCKHYDVPLSEYPCFECNSKWSKWEPIAETKEEDMENENKNTTLKIDTEAELKAQVEELKEQVEELQEELEQAKEKNEDQRRVIDGLNNELERKNGMVDGLKFAIRCNGVSGGEV